jgi:hypothetical protein
MHNSLHQNLPTQIAKVFSNLEIMQYQYWASNQYWKTATDPLRFWLLKKQFGLTVKIFFTKTHIALMFSNLEIMQYQYWVFNSQKRNSSVSVFQY